MAIPRTEILPLAGLLILWGSWERESLLPMGDFGVANQSNLLVFGLREEAGVPTENPCTWRKCYLIKKGPDSNRDSDPSSCEV